MALLKRNFEEGFSLRHLASRGGLRGDAFIIAFVRGETSFDVTFGQVHIGQNFNNLFENENLKKCYFAYHYLISWRQKTS